MFSMGTYITQTDINSVYGSQSVAAWSVLDHDGDTATADSTQVNTAIEKAEKYVESRFRGSRYAVPFSGADLPLVRHWMAVWAGVLLFQPRGSTAGRDEEVATKVARNQSVALEEMDAVLAGMRRVDLAAASTGGTAPFVVC